MYKPFNEIYVALQPEYRKLFNEDPSKNIDRYMQYVQGVLLRDIASLNTDAFNKLLREQQEQGRTLQSILTKK